MRIKWICLKDVSIMTLFSTVLGGMVEEWYNFLQKFIHFMNNKLLMTIIELERCSSYNSFFNTPDQSLEIFTNCKGTIL
jgi:hypothetical protein